MNDKLATTKVKLYQTFPIMQTLSAQLSWSHLKLEDDKKIRFYLWAYEHDFVVILQKLGNTSSYLVTSFYIDNQRKRDIFQRKFEDYQNGTDIRLRGEWF